MIARVTTEELFAFRRDVDAAQLSPGALRVLRGGAAVHGGGAVAPESLACGEGFLLGVLPLLAKTGAVTFAVVPTAWECMAHNSEYTYHESTQKKLHTAEIRCAHFLCRDGLSVRAHVPLRRHRSSFSHLPLMKRCGGVPSGFASVIPGRIFCFQGP